MAVIAVGLATCVAADSVATPSTVATPPQLAPAYAYSTQTDLVVVRGDVEIARTNLLLTTFDEPEPAWTVDGRYLVGVSNRSGSPDGALLVVVNATTGEVRHIVCPSCTSAAPVGQSMVLVSQDNERGQLASYLKFDLTSPEAPVRFSLELPPLRAARFLVGMDGEVLINGVSEDRQDTFYRLGPDGSAEAVGVWNNPYTGYEFERRVKKAVALRRASGVQYAVLVQIRQDNCARADQVLLINTDQQTITSSNLALITPSSHAPGYDAAVIVHDLWAVGNDRLRAIMFAATCDEPRTTTTLPSEWRLEGDRWVSGSGERLMGLRQLDDQTWLLISGPELSLFFETDGVQKKIANEVLSVSAPPTTGTDLMGERQAPEKESASAVELDCDQARVSADCRGVREGDLDGDGKTDYVGLFYEGPDAGVEDLGKLTVHVELGSGEQHQATLYDAVPSHAGKWLGLSDVNGDGKDDLFVQTDTGAHLLTVKMVTYAGNGSFAELPGEVTELYLDASQYSYVGFRCANDGGRTQLVTFTASADLRDPTQERFGVEEVFYEADTTGALKKIDTRQSAYPTAGSKAPPEVVVQAGAHCPGLVEWPGR